MKIVSYVVRELGTPFLVATTLLSAIVVSYTITMAMFDSTNGFPPMPMAAYQVVLKVVAVLDVILPSALYFAVIFGLGRLYRDAEIVALKAAGFGDRQLMYCVIGFAMGVALLSSLAANLGRPWAFQVNYVLQARAESMVDIGRLNGGGFVQLTNADSVLFAGSVNHASGRLEDVYTHSAVGSERSRVVVAHTLQLPTPDVAGARRMIFGNGSIYLLDHRGANDQVLAFETLALPIAGTPAELDRRSKPMDTSRLVHSHRPSDIAELQWRLASPFTTILLAFLGIRFSHTSQLPTTRTRTILAIAVYALLFGLFGVAHSLVDQGLVGAVPGLWWFYVPPLTLLWLVHIEPFAPRDRTAPRQADAVRILDRYIATALIRGCVVVFAILLSLFAFLALVRELDEVGQHGYRMADAAFFVALTLPRSALDLAPIAALLGCLLGLGTLGRGTELVAMLTLGVSLERFVWSVAKPVIGLVATCALISQFVAPPMQQLAERHRSAVTTLDAHRTERDAIWARDAHQILRLRRQSNEQGPYAFELYQFNAQGQLSRYVQAQQAVALESEWRLTDVSIKSFVDGVMAQEHRDAMIWPSFLSNTQLADLQLPAESLSLVELYRHIKYLRGTGQPSAEVELIFWQRLFLPLNVGVMAMLAVPFGFVLQRNNISRQLMLGAALGMSISLFSQVGVALGAGAVLSLPFASALPLAILVAITGALFLRVARRGVVGAAK